MKISYQIKLEKQGTMECVQASAVQILNYYGIDKSLADVKNEVPVYIDSQGITRGTSLGHIGTYFQQLGLNPTIHTSDIIIFDPSWHNLTTTEILSKLELRRSHLTHGWYDQPTLTTMVDGYIQYLKSGGKLVLPIVDSNYLLHYLKEGPLYLVVSYNVLNRCSKYDFHYEDKQDDILGIPSTHAIIVSGHQNGFFDIVDPDDKFGGYRKISESQLLAAYYLAETDYDCLFMSLKK